MPHYQSFGSPEQYVSWAREHTSCGLLSDRALGYIWRFHCSFPHPVPCGEDFATPCDTTGLVRDLSRPLDGWEEFHSAMDALCTYSMDPRYDAGIDGDTYPPERTPETQEEAALAYWSQRTVVIDTGSSVVIYMPS